MKQRYVLFHLSNQLYVKLGGGYTPNLEEAQVVGWNAPKKWPWNLKHLFEIRPVTISLKGEE